MRSSRIPSARRLIAAMAITTARIAARIVSSQSKRCVTAMMAPATATAAAAAPSDRVSRDRLEPLDPTGWESLDRKIDNALKAVRSTAPDPTAEKQSLNELLGALQ